MLGNIFKYYRSLLNFNGRIGRFEFFKGFAFIAVPLLFILQFVGPYLFYLSTLMDAGEEVSFLWFWIIVAVLAPVYCLYAVIALITLHSRRLHDINLSGWVSLIVILLTIGIYFLFSVNILPIILSAILLIIAGDKVKNKYGEVPS